MTLIEKSPWSAVGPRPKKEAEADMDTLNLDDTLALTATVAMPRLGLGVFRAGEGAGTRDAVLHALTIGYRHIDTAAVYRNEVEVGEALQRTSLPRSALFVTTKLWNDDHGYDAARRAFDASLERLGLDYVDLYLIHWPVPEGRRESWRALEAIADSGRARTIGVSNYTERHLTELLGHARIPPAVNQVEVHPFLPQRSLRAFCADHGIAVAAYSPLTKGRRLDDETLVDLAREVGRTPAQVLLRWGLQQGMAVLPKSSHPSRIEQNARLFDFDLSTSLLERLDGLEDGGRTAWDPTDVA